ncbi:MAG: Asp-tRNA(Asn) amidotransferase subunit GatC [Candidatus Hadarchaeum sp.]|uniref:Asp-tRNA(Asn) amidotransferase subunit GatC n=1 Tax=Candidatus Hadarchaeum sp. TaxID=2883567 RepID=UPI003D0F8B06
MVEKQGEIERGAEEIIASFLKATENLPEIKETYYSLEAYNVVRPDDEPSPPEECAAFRSRFLSLMPKSDELGNLKVEVAKWSKER